MRQEALNIILVLFLLLLGSVSVEAQGTLIDFNTIPKSGTVLVYSHMDDDLIWMLPFWKITEKFIGGAMPATPVFMNIASQQQAFLNNNGYNIAYEQNWEIPWGTITHKEYDAYYWDNKSDYTYLADDHLIAFWDNNDDVLVRKEINRIKAKIEQYIAGDDVSRIITHNNWGEYGHQHHKAINKAVRELAVKYKKDVWMLGCNNGDFVDVNVPNGITYTYGSYNDPDLYTGIRSIYKANYCWTWTDVVPSGNHKYIKIVDSGVDKSNILTGESVTSTGPSQNEPGAFIFDGSDDYMTLEGNNASPFTISMRIRPDLIRGMDIAAMSEYPFSAKNDRNLYLNNDGRISARIYDGISRVVTSSSAITSGNWTNITITGDGSYLKIYINGILNGTVSAGSAITSYSSPELVLGQATITSSYFMGQIIDVRLYDHVLSDSEIADLTGIVYNITAGAGDGGSISSVGTSTVDVGSNMSYIITPNTGYRISDVNVDGNSAGIVSAYTFNNIATNHNIFATFTPIRYTIIGNADTGGSISPDGFVGVDYGTSRTYSITPDVGYKIADVKVDGNSVGTVSSYVFSNVLSDHTISATFNLISYTITGSAGAGGSINPSGAVTVNYGTSLACSITPQTGYKITNVIVDGISSGSISSYTFENIKDDHTISASFSRITYNLTCTAGSRGVINPSGTTQVTYGADQDITITPSEGFYISDVIVDNSSVGPVSVYALNNITSNHTVSASFEQITFTVSSASNEGGSINPSGNNIIKYGNNLTFTIVPDYGYHISDVKVDGSSNGVISEYTFNNIKADHNITAEFSINKYDITASCNPGGTITPSGEVVINHGMDQVFNITPENGYQINDVVVDNNSVGKVTEYTFKNVTADHKISVLFIKTYTISAKAGIGGSVTPSGLIVIPEGAYMKFNIVPDRGYRIKDVIVDNHSEEDVAEYAFTEVSSDHSIIASFTKDINVIVFPNPFKEQLNLQIKSPGEFRFEMYIETLTNKTVYKQDNIPGNSLTPLNLNLAPGLYILKLYLKGINISTIKIIRN